MNSFYKLAFLMCLFLSSIQADTVEIRGQIIDAQSGQPIRYAKVFVSPVEMETQSNKDGKFILSGIPKSDVDIIISAIGLPKLNIKKRLDQDLTDLGLITLSTEVIKLDEILVKIRSNKIHQSLSSLHLRTNENKLLDSNLADSLSDLPGLAKGSIGPSATRPVLRGYSGDRFKITEGGITLGDLSQTSVDHAVGVDMANVESIEIVRGPKSLIFGSNAIGGVIDISKRSYSHKQINQPHYSSKAGYQSVNNGMFGTFHLQVPFDNKEVQFYSLKRKTGNLKTPIAQLHNTELDKYELSAGIVGFSDQSARNFSINLLDMDYGIPGSKEGHINGARISIRQLKQRFHYHQNLSARHFKELDIDQRNIHYVHSEFEATQPNASVNMNQNIFSLQGKLTGPKITAGMLLQLREFMTSGFYWTPDTREVNFAFFSLFEREILDLIAQSSLRAEFLMIDPKTTSHRLSNMEYSEVIRQYFNTISASFQISKNWSNMETSILTMLTSKAPKIEDLYSDGPHLGTYSYEIGNPTLGLERTIGVEASAKYIVTKGWLRLSSYLNYSPNFHTSSKMGDGYKTGANWIEWGSGSSGWLYKYQMTGAETLITGLEADFMCATKYIRISGSLSGILGQNLNTNQPLILIPPPKGMLNFELNQRRFLTKVQIERCFEQNRLGQFETKTASYFLVNIHGIYNFDKKLSGKKQKVALYMNNIFNEKYYNHLSRIKDIMPEPGRNLSLQYELDF